MQRWEYHTELFEADVKSQQEFLSQRWPNRAHGKNSPLALIPLLNGLGAAGWELVEIRPVVAGSNSDILVHTNVGAHWSATYLCTFKRLLDTE